MKCETCKEKDATVHIKQVFSGEVKELFVCETCASRSGLDNASGLSLSDLLFGNAQPPAPGKPPDPGRTCASCGMSQADFQKSQRLGCAACYESFAEELVPILTSMYRDRKHAGKIPASEQVTAEMAALQKALDDCVQAQNFEEAARLRDLLSDLRSTRAPVATPLGGDNG